MEAKAAARAIRIVPRKVRLVLDLVRGRNVAETIAISKLTDKASSPVIEKVLVSALANAEHNYDMSTGELVVKEVYANEEPILRHFRPYVQGRASAISERTSRITVVISDGKKEAKEA